MNKTEPKSPHSELFRLFPEWFGQAGEYCCCSFGVGAGWAPILLDLAWEIREILHDAGIPEGEYAVDQVKEKFALLRWYDSLYVKEERDENNDPSVARKIWDVTGRAEALSGKTCEYCGADGQQTTTGYWIKTLCNECESKRQNTPDYFPTGI